MMTKEGTPDETRGNESVLDLEDDWRNPRLDWRRWKCLGGRRKGPQTSPDQRKWKRLGRRQKEPQTTEVSVRTTEGTPDQPRPGEVKVSRETTEQTPSYKAEGVKVSRGPQVPARGTIMDCSSTEAGRPCKHTVPEPGRGGRQCQTRARRANSLVKYWFLRCYRTHSGLLRSARAVMRAQRGCRAQSPDGVLCVTQSGIDVYGYLCWLIVRGDAAGMEWLFFSPHLPTPIPHVSDASNADCSLFFPFFFLTVLWG